jgi:hypothetical protein
MNVRKRPDRSKAWIQAWHPCGMRMVLGWCPGGVVAALLNHRLMARNPPGSHSRERHGKYGAEEKDFVMAFHRALLRRKEAMSARFR